MHSKSARRVRARDGLDDMCPVEAILEEDPVACGRRIFDDWLELKRLGPKAERYC